MSRPVPTLGPAAAVLLLCALGTFTAALGQGASAVLSLRIGSEGAPEIVLSAPLGTRWDVQRASVIAGAGGTEWRSIREVWMLDETVAFSDLAGDSSRTRFYRAQSPLIPRGPSGFTWVRPGSFTMGSPVDQPDRGLDEASHLVSLSHGFWMQTTEVTQAQFKDMTGMNPSLYQGADLPVTEVSWHDATNYCGLLVTAGRAAGTLPAWWTFRLPTEAEWEYACRAGSRSETAFGPVLDSNHANFNGTYPYNGAEPGPFLGHPSVVRSYPPNEWGLCDMAGNVWEWCQDWYTDYPTGAVTDPQGPTTGLFKVLRGGGWLDPGSACTSSARQAMIPTSVSAYDGFRVVLAPVDPRLDPSAPDGFVHVPPGSFMMGSPDDEPGRDPDEPAHQVTLTSGFWISRFEVSQAQFVEVTGTNRSFFRGPLLPVEQVTWLEAMDYCSKLTAKGLAEGWLPAGWTCRLPTEAEWEYACRAGETAATSFGAGLSSIQANFDGTKPYANAAPGPYLSRTTALASYAANAWGLFDMAGNVAEWCSDWYAPYATGEASDPQGASTGSARVVRGGGWYQAGVQCRSAARDAFPPQSRGNHRGFRVVLARAR